jgi:hypothetical protein
MLLQMPGYPVGSLPGHPAVQMQPLAVPTFTVTIDPQPPVFTAPSPAQDGGVVCEPLAQGSSSPFTTGSFTTGYAPGPSAARVVVEGMVVPPVAAPVADATVATPADPPNAPRTTALIDF